MLIVEPEVGEEDIIITFLDIMIVWEMIEPEEKVVGLRISEEPKKKPCLKISRVTWDNIEHVLNILKYN